MTARLKYKLTAGWPGGRADHPHTYLPADHNVRGVLIVLAAMVVMAVGFGGLGLISVFMGPMETDLGWSRSAMSFGYAMSTAGMAIGGLFWGRLSDRMDVRLLFVIGATGMVTSLLAMTLLQSLFSFYAVLVVYGGLGFSVLYAPLLSTSCEWFPERRGLVTGLVTAGGALGQGLLPFFASFLINSFDWRWAYFGIGCTVMATLVLALPLLRWPRRTTAPAATAANGPEVSRDQRTTVAFLALAAFLCCMCMGVPLVHMASFIGSVCGSPGVGVNSLLTAMAAGAVGRVCFGSIADSIGAVKTYAVASATQTACVMAFPALNDSLSFLVLSAIFGFGFAGNMTCLALCVRQAVPMNRVGGAIGFVMMVAWAGMAAGGYAGGLLFDLSLSYTLSFLVAGVAGILNLAVLAALALTRTGTSMSAPSKYSEIHLAGSSSAAISRASSYHSPARGRLCRLVTT